MLNPHHPQCTKSCQSKLCNFCYCVWYTISLFLYIWERSVLSVNFQLQE